MHLKDTILRGLSLEELVATVYANEGPYANRQKIKLIFSQLIADSVTDAQYTLEQNIDQIEKLIRDF